MATDFDNLSPDQQRQLREATRELNEIPLRYAVDVFIASRLASPVQGGLNNATGIPLEVQGKFLLATASHVLAKFEERVAQEDDTLFQAARVVLGDPDGRVAWRDKGRDVVLLEMTGEASATASPWPPPLPSENSLVITASFPVEGRTTDLDRRAVELKALQCMFPSEARDRIVSSVPSSARIGMMFREWDRCRRTQTAA